jgi:hypothetical protein
MSGRAAAQRCAFSPSVVIYCVAATASHRVSYVKGSTLDCDHIASRRGIHPRDVVHGINADRML